MASSDFALNAENLQSFTRFVDFIPVLSCFPMASYVYSSLNQVKTGIIGTRRQAQEAQAYVLKSRRAQI